MVRPEPKTTNNTCRSQIRQQFADLISNIQTFRNGMQRCRDRQPAGEDMNAFDDMLQDMARMIRKLQMLNVEFSNCLPLRGVKRLPEINKKGDYFNNDYWYFERETNQPATETETQETQE